MNRFVLDCSVVFGFSFEDEDTKYVMKVAEALRTGEAMVPAIFTAEVANVLKVQESRKRWTEEQIFEFLSILEKLPLTVEDTSLFDSRTLFTLAKKENLSAYDASYLALALEYNIPLATQDKALKKAAAKRKVFFKA